MYKRGFKLLSGEGQALNAVRNSSGVEATTGSLNSLGSNRHSVSSSGIGQASGHSVGRRHTISSQNASLEGQCSARDSGSCLNLLAEGHNDAVHSAGGLVQIAVVQSVNSSDAGDSGSSQLLDLGHGRLSHITGNSNSGGSLNRSSIVDAVQNELGAANVQGHLHRIRGLSNSRSGNLDANLLAGLDAAFLAGSNSNRDGSAIASVESGGASLVQSAQSLSSRNGSHSVGLRSQASGVDGDSHSLGAIDRRDSQRSTSTSIDVGSRQRGGNGSTVNLGDLEGTVVAGQIDLQRANLSGLVTANGQSLAGGVNIVDNNLVELLGKDLESQLLVIGIARILAGVGKLTILQILGDGQSIEILAVGKHINLHSGMRTVSSILGSSVVDGVAQSAIGSDSVVDGGRALTLSTVGTITAVGSGSGGDSDIQLLQDLVVAIGGLTGIGVGVGVGVGSAGAVFFSHFA